MPRSFSTLEYLKQKVVQLKNIYSKKVRIIFYRHGKDSLYARFKFQRWAFKEDIFFYHHQRGELHVTNGKKVIDLKNLWSTFL